MKIIRIIFPLLFCGLLVGGWYYRKSSVGVKAQPPRDLVVLYRETLYPADKSQPARDLSLRERWIRADGSWKEYRFDKYVDRTITWVHSPEGSLLFNSSVKKGEYNGHFQKADLRYQSPEFLKAHPGFVREDRLLGYPAFVVRTNVQGEWDWAENWYVPDITFLPIKLVESTRRGQQVIEPFNVHYTPVTEGHLEKPDFEIDTTAFQIKIDNLRAKGRTEEADHKQHALNDFIAKQAEKKASK
jgi:hypothetical protein